MNTTTKLLLAWLITSAWTLVKESHWNTAAHTYTRTHREKRRKEKKQIRDRHGDRERNWHRYLRRTNPIEHLARKDRHDVSPFPQCSSLRSHERHRSLLLTITSVRQQMSKWGNNVPNYARRESRERERERATTIGRRLIKPPHLTI
jgi:hypothetical protein